MGKLRKHQLFAKLNKCELWLEDIKSIEHVIFKERVVMDLSKIKVVLDWQCPTIVHEVRSFIALAGYYRRFMEEFSKLSSLITMLTRRNSKFIWTEQCEQDFEELKRS